MEDKNTDEYLQELKGALQYQLKQTGIGSTVRHLIREICSSRGTDALSLDPEEVLHEIRSRGLLTNTLSRLRTLPLLQLERSESDDGLAYGQGRRRYKSYSSGEGGTPSSSDLDSTPSQLEVNDDEFQGKSPFSRGDSGDILPASESDRIDTARPASYYYNGSGAERVEKTTDFDFEGSRTKLVPKDGKFYMKLEFLGGRAFLENFYDNAAPAPVGAAECSKSLLGMHTPGLQLHVFYKSQRFCTKRVECACEPQFKDNFIVEIGCFKGEILTQILDSVTPLKFILVRDNESTLGNSVLISCRMCDWSSILASENCSQRFTLELHGIGPEHSVTVGLLDIRITILPPPNEQIAKPSFMSRISMEKCKQDEMERNYLFYTKQWWKDFVEIRTTHEKRMVQIFSYDENMISRPVQSFIRKLKIDRIIRTPTQAAWFVAQIPCYTLFGATGTTRLTPATHWQTLEATLTSKSGNMEDHAILLCSLLLELGLNCYIAIGCTFRDIPWMWVVTLDTIDNQVIPTFWESTTGKGYQHSLPPRVKGETAAEHQARCAVKERKSHLFKSIDCLFNDRVLLANIQSSTLIDQIDWSFLNHSKWKQIPECKIQALIEFRETLTLRSPLLNTVMIAVELELQLKSLASDARMIQNLSTKWDDSLAKLLGQELARHEFKYSTGGSDFPSHLQTVVMNHIPAGHDFKALPLHFSCSHDARVIFREYLKQPKSEEIIFCQGSDVRLAVRVEVFAYPEDVTSVHVMFACSYLSI